MSEKEKNDIHAQVYKVGAVLFNLYQKGGK